MKLISIFYLFSGSFDKEVVAEAMKDIHEGYVEGQICFKIPEMTPERKKELKSRCESLWNECKEKLEERLVFFCFIVC